MKNLRFISILSLCLYMSLSASRAYSAGLQTIDVNGTPWFVYTTDKDDSLFGIARRYSWNDSILAAFNPDISSPLKKDIRIFYPASIETPPTAGVTSETKPNRAPYVYTASHDDSARSIAEANGISVEALFISNPGLTPRSLKDGTAMLIPEEGSGIKQVTTRVERTKIGNFKIYTAVSSDTWQSIADRFNIDSDLLRSVNAGTERIKKNTNVYVPVFEKYFAEETSVYKDPRELSLSGVNEIYAEVHRLPGSAAMSPLKLLVLLQSPSDKKDIEFVRGFLAGMQDSRKDRAGIELKVIDGSAPKDSVMGLIREFNPNLLFLTHDSDIPSYVGSYAMESRTPVIVSFDVKNEEYLSNPYFIQLISPSNYFNESIADYARANYAGYTLVMIGEEDDNDQLAAALKGRWPLTEIIYIPLGLLESYEPTSQERLLFYGYDTKKENVKAILANIARINENAATSSNVVLGRPNWIVYGESLKDELQKVNTLVPARFYIDEKSYAADKFNSSYRELFSRNPVKSVPLYAGVGYDNAVYFINAMINSGFDINRLFPATTSLQSSIDLERINNWSGFVNLPVYLINFTPFDITQKIVVKNTVNK